MLLPGAYSEEEKVKTQFLGGSLWQKIFLAKSIFY